MSSFEIPTVDIGAYVTDGTAQQRAAVARAIDVACRSVGFVQITGHGVDDATITGLTRAIDTFFALPQQVKERWIRPAAENRGYTPPKSESLALSAGVVAESRMKDFFEAFNVGSSASDYPQLDLTGGHHAENTWPQVEGFREAVDAWRAQAGRVARTMVTIFEDALGLAGGTISGLARHPIEVLRMNNYALPAGVGVQLDEDLIGMGEHTDYGIVTILWADQVKGLQVLHEGRWHDASPAEGALLINLGDLTTRLTNEQWRSTLHRVKPPIVDGTIRRRRSAAYFFDGDPQARIGPLPGFVDDAHPAVYLDVTVDEHIQAKLAGSRAGVLNPNAGREADRVLAVDH